jgi:CRP-like cAMP-binding protein
MGMKIAMRLTKDDLRELDLFSGTSRSELDDVARQLTMLTVPAGKVLVREGERGDEFMIISEGEAEVRQGGRTIARIGRGGLIGEMALLEADGRGRRNATVTTVTDAVIYVGSPREFRQIIEIAPSVAEKVQRTAAERTATGPTLTAA